MEINIYLYNPEKGYELKIKEVSEFEIAGRYMDTQRIDSVKCYESGCVNIYCSEKKDCKSVLRNEIEQKLNNKIIETEQAVDNNMK